VAIIPRLGETEFVSHSCWICHSVVFPKIILGEARYRSQGALMLDLILIALGLGFFAASVAYAYACDRL
jgi:hypothetical protein